MRLFCSLCHEQYVFHAFDTAIRQTRLRMSRLGLATVIIPTEINLFNRYQELISKGGAREAIADQSFERYASSPKRTTLFHPSASCSFQDPRFVDHVFMHSVTTIVGFPLH